MGKIDVVLKDSCLEIRIERSIPADVIVPKLEYAGKI